VNSVNSAAENSFPLSTTPELLLKLPVKETLAESKKQECWSYGEVFFSRARASGEEIAEIARAWRLLGQLCQVGLQADNPNEPFRPAYEAPDGRSIVPSDLDVVTANAVHQLGIATEDPELQARLLDITWDRLRLSDAARNAVQSYLSTARRLFDPDHWTGYATRIERALRLAQQLNDAALLETVLAEIDNRVIELDGSDPLYLTSELMDLLYEFKKGDPSLMSKIAQKAAEAAEQKKDFDRRRTYLENVSKWRRRAGDSGGEREARIAIAQSYERQAELHSKEGGELLVVHFLEKAHEVYRSISDMRVKTKDIYEKLREAQRVALGAMRAIRTPGIDISELVKAARERVSGKSFRESLLSLATVTRPTNFERETERAKQLMAKFPLQSFLGGVKIDRDGRVIAHRTPALGEEEGQAEQALWERVVEQVSMMYQLTVQAEILPALSQVTFEHSPTIQDMRDLVINNPFVPRGHEELFAKGIVYGLRESFPEALSILVPQMENSLRYLLSRAGAEVTKRDKLGLQSVIQMGAILSERTAELEAIIGVDAVKELKVLFSDQHGADLRNRIAHGLMSHGDFFSPSAIYAWWFILFLCINPVYRRFQSMAKMSDNDASPEKPETATK
jgi:hypothetical protein